MIEEYARHNGHADLLRERIDGTTGALGRGLARLKHDGWTKIRPLSVV